MKPQDKILVIDDDLLQLKIIQNILASENYDVCFANNGAQGIQKAFEYNPDLILCDIKMGAIDGHHVFNVLKESSLLDQVPFMFMTSNSELKDIRTGLDLGADDYFIKPLDNEVLMKSIKKRLNKFRKLKEIGKQEFNTLFKITPNGIFLFDGDIIFNVNPALQNMTGRNGENLKFKTIEELIDTVSYLSIEDKINRCSMGLLDSFKEKVFLKTAKMGLIEVNLHVSVYEKFSTYSLMLGLITPMHDEGDGNDGFLSGVHGVLKQGKVVVNETFERHLTEVLRKTDTNLECCGHGFFSRREIEVLCLSMEGLPMKQIADKLSISDRTVEKHRANLMERTNSKNMIEVIVFALRNNLIEI